VEIQNKLSFSLTSSCLIIAGVEGCVAPRHSQCYTLGKPPLDKKSTRCRGVNLKTENIRNGHAYRQQDSNPQSQQAIGRTSVP